VFFLDFICQEEITEQVYNRCWKCPASTLLVCFVPLCEVFLGQCWQQSVQCGVSVRTSVAGFRTNSLRGASHLSTLYDAWHVFPSQTLNASSNVSNLCIVLFGTSFSGYASLNASRTTTNDFVAKQCSRLNTRSARECTMFAPAGVHLQGDLDWSVMG
jgi:hypothetical protein